MTTDISNENPETNIISDDLKETLKKRLELELGLPLQEKTTKELNNSYTGSEILLENYPLQSIQELKINDTIIDPSECIIFEDEGIIQLPREYQGRLYIEYTYGINESEYMPLLDLMLEYETSTDYKKDATSVKELNVSINYDTRFSKGALIQEMITELRNRYHCVVRMI